jgi:glycosyltransferase involved in cell wall biosynthesis
LKKHLKIVLFLVHHGRGGSTIALLPYLEAFKLHDICVVSRRDDDGLRLLQPYVKKNIICKFPLTVNNTAMDEFETFWESLFKAIKDFVKLPIGVLVSMLILIKEKPDVVFIGDFPLLSVMISCIITQTKSVLLIQTSISENILKNDITAWCIGKVDIVIGITKMHIVQIKKYKSSHAIFMVIHNTIVELPDIQSQYGEYFKNLEIGTKKVILFFGGISKIKGTESFVKVALKVLENRNDISFIIAGPFNKHFKTKYATGTTTTDLDLTKIIIETINRSANKEKFRIIGETNHVNELIDHSAFQIVMNEYAHFSRPIIEGWARKKPTIASKDKYTEYIIDADINGLLIARNNIDGWVKAIDTLLDDAESVTQLGENGYEKYLNYYSMEQSMQQIKSILNNLEGN